MSMQIPPEGQALKPAVGHMEIDNAGKNVIIDHGYKGEIYRITADKLAHLKDACKLQGDDLTWATNLASNGAACLIAGITGKFSPEIIGSILLGIGIVAPLASIPFFVKHFQRPRRILGLLDTIETTPE